MWQNLHSSGMKPTKNAFKVFFLLAGLIVIALSVVLFLQHKANSRLNKSFKERQEEAKAAQKASRKLEELEKQSDELTALEKKIHQRIPRSEQYPFELFRTVSGIAGPLGLSGLTFTVKTAPANSEQGNPLLNAHYFEMKFNATFIQLKDFLKELHALERLIRVERVVIRRDEKKLPFQDVVIDAVTYSFAPQLSP